MHIDLPREVVYMPRERALAEGVSSLGDAELLAILLGTGCRGTSVVGLAQRLLDAFEGLDGLGQAGAFVIADRPGIGVVKALRVLAGMELGRRFVYRKGRRREALDSSMAVFERFAPVLGGLDSEQLWVMSVDACNMVRGCRQVALGGVHACATHPRDILRLALADGAVGLIVVHNHPSGNPSPSMDDVVLTKRVMAAADLVGITLVDHLIISGIDDYRSMLDLGLIPERIPAAADLPHRPYGTRLVPPLGAP